MASHPMKAVPGAIRGRRPKVLPAERAGEVYELTAAGWTMNDMATELGVSPRALYYSQRRCSEISEALSRGREEYRRRLAAELERLAAERVAAAAADRAAARKAAPEAMALLGIVPDPPAIPSAPPRTPLPLDSQLPARSTSQRAAGPTSGSGACPPPPTPSTGEFEALGAPLPLDDPLAGW